jgi:hypothetical protein
VEIGRCDKKLIVITATEINLKATGWTIGAIGFRFPERATNISLRHRVKTGSGPHPASYSIGAEDSFPESKAVEV